MTAQVKKSKSSSNSSLRIAVLFIAVIIIGLLVGLFSPSFKPFFKKLANTISPAPTITLTPTPFPTVIPGNLRPLPTGIQVFEVQSGNNSGPSISKLTINPLDIIKGGNQTVSLMVDYKSPVKSVILTTVTDNKSTPHELKLVSGTANNGKWEGAWIVDDGNYFKYIMNIEAIAESGAKSTLNPIFR